MGEVRPRTSALSRPLTRRTSSTPVPLYYCLQAKGLTHAHEEATLEAAKAAQEALLGERASRHDTLDALRLQVLLRGAAREASGC